MNTNDRRGFTLVEATIVAVVIAVVLAVLIPVMRERERQRLQALAETEPWEVFEFRAKSAEPVWTTRVAHRGSDTVEILARKEIVVRCEIENLTDYPLTLPTDLRSLALTFGDTNYILGLPSGLPLLRPETNIAKGESVEFEQGFKLLGTGEAMFRVSCWNDSGLVNGRMSEIPTLRERRHFQSNTIKLVVEATDYSKLQTFDEIISDLME